MEFILPAGRHLSAQIFSMRSLSIQKPKLVVLTRTIESVDHTGQATMSPDTASESRIADDRAWRRSKLKMEAPDSHVNSASTTFTMILVQKPPLSPSPLHAHRRHPSAPIPTMLPTSTPGLFTLSKPPRPKRKPLPKSKATTTVVRASLLNLPTEITDNKKSAVADLPETPLRRRPGRGQVKHTKSRAQNQRCFRLFLNGCDLG